MRRTQLCIEEDLDKRLGLLAAREGVSKASLIREAVAERYAELAPDEDPLDSLIGSLDVVPAAVDDVVYGPTSDAGVKKAAAPKRRRPRS